MIGAVGIEEKAQKLPEIDDSKVEAEFDAIQMSERIKRKTFVDHQKMLVIAWVYISILWNPAANVINKFKSSVPMQCWNKVLWSVKNSHGTWSSESEYFISKDCS